MRNEETRRIGGICLFAIPLPAPIPLYWQFLPAEKENHETQKGQRNMEINVKITQVFDGQRSVKAKADIFIDNFFVIHDALLCETANGRFVAMPFKTWTDRNGEEKKSDIAHPISSSARKELCTMVVNAYEAYMAGNRYH